MRLRVDVISLFAERIADSTEARSKLREAFAENAMLDVKAGAKASDAEAEEHADFQGKGIGTSSRAASERLVGLCERASALKPHTVLAINRGEAQKLLRVSLKLEPKERAFSLLHASTLPADWEETPGRRELMAEAAAEAYNRLLLPAMSRELRKEMSKGAEEVAVKVFAKNVEALLMQRPVRGRRILGVDPGFRTGCKLTAIDEEGKACILKRKKWHMHGPHVSHIWHTRTHAPHASHASHTPSTPSCPSVTRHAPCHTHAPCCPPVAHTHARHVWSSRLSSHLSSRLS